MIERENVEACFVEIFQTVQFIAQRLNITIEPHCRTTRQQTTRSNDSAENIRPNIYKKDMCISNSLMHFFFF